MAAVIQIPAHQPSPTRLGTRPGPRLVVLDGGRPVGPASAVSAASSVSAATYRRRRIAALVGLVVGVWAASMIAVGAARLVVGGPDAASSPPAVHVVQPGETLWGIASGWDLDGDIRAIVHEIASANGGTQIRPGQRLVIPAHVSDI